MHTHNAIHRQIGFEQTFQNRTQMLCLRNLQFTPTQNTYCKFVTKRPYLTKSYNHVWPNSVWSPKTTKGCIFSLCLHLLLKTEYMAHYRMMWLLLLFFFLLKHLLSNYTQGFFGTPTLLMILLYNLIEIHVFILVLVISQGKKVVAFHHLMFTMHAVKTEWGKVM